MSRRIWVIVAILAAIIISLKFFSRSSSVGNTILLAPNGFSIETVASDIEDAWAIAFDPQGRVLVSQPDQGRVVVLEDGKPRTILENLNKPSGIDFLQEETKSKITTTYLYVAESHRVVRYQYDEKTGIVENPNGRVVANMPEDKLHTMHGIGFGKNFRTSQIIQGSSKVNTLTQLKFYISAGSSCDACVEDSWKRAAILESDAAGSYTAEFAGGLRNVEFFTTHPDTGELWAGDIGRTDLGKTLPPDEINIIKVAGEGSPYGARRYGWPFCYGKQVTDSSFKPGTFSRQDIPQDCAKTEPATIELPAHVIPMGIAFVPKSWPSPWAGRLLVAYHGSNLGEKSAGYKIVWFDVDPTGVVRGNGDFVNGWLDGKQVRGQPTGLKFASDGSLYVTDATAGKVYRIKP